MTFAGVFLIILGVCMLAVPVFFGALVVMLAGVIMTAAGIVECVFSFQAFTRLSRITWLLVGLVTLICGVLVLAHPVLGLGFLTILLAAYFLIDGFMKLGSAMKRDAYRGWFLTSGLLSLLLAYLIWANWPLSGGWAIGVLMGVNFIFTGVMTLVVGEALKP